MSGFFSSDRPGPPKTGLLKKQPIGQTHQHAAKVDVEVSMPIKRSSENWTDGGENWQIVNPDLQASAHLLAHLRIA